MFLLAACGWAKPVLAADQRPSADVKGIIGLNTIPTARMDAAGTIRVGVSHADPYNHAFIGLQIASPLYVNLRQSMIVSSVGDRPDAVTPGMDFKLRLTREGRYMPEVAFGMDSVLGHKRFSSEYFALSKRWYDFDFTAGLAWGRMAGDGLIPNPFGRSLPRFKKDRDPWDEDAASPADWFTGDKIGVFGGVEYFTPVNGLSLKADYGADSYTAEKRLDLGYEKPASWSIGLNFAPKEWISLGAAMLGTDKIMARLTFQMNANQWKGRPYKKQESLAFNAKVPARTDINAPRKSAVKEGINFGKIRTGAADFSAVLHLNDFQPAAMQLGRAARHLAANAGPDIQTIILIPVRDGVRGKAVNFSRRGLDQAFLRKTASPEELWRDVRFSDDDRSISMKDTVRTFKIIPSLDFSPLEEETTHLYRTGVVVEEQKDWRFGIRTGTSVRLNIADNLHRLAKFRDMNLASVRSDIDRFTENRINLDRNFLSWMTTIRPDVHFAATAGYLEEMYAGGGGELLYRPFDSPFAIGVDAWNVYKRDGASPLALALTGVSAFTGHVTGYYDVPGTDITAYAKVGQFIAGDRGVQTGAQTVFENGVKIKGFVAVTDADDKDAYGSDRNAYGGFQISLPLGNIPFVPQGSEVRTAAAPIGRDDAALLDKPVSLYAVTEPMSYRRLGRDWQAVLD